jgi:hypothetical protein
VDNIGHWPKLRQMPRWYRVSDTLSITTSTLLLKNALMGAGPLCFLVLQEGLRSPSPADVVRGHHQTDLGIQHSGRLLVHLLPPVKTERGAELQRLSLVQERDQATLGGGFLAHAARGV